MTESQRKIIDAFRLSAVYNAATQKKHFGKFVVCPIFYRLLVERLEEIDEQLGVVSDIGKLYIQGVLIEEDVPVDEPVLCS